MQQIYYSITSYPNFSAIGCVIHCYTRWDHGGKEYYKTSHQCFTFIWLFEGKDRQDKKVLAELTQFPAGFRNPCKYVDIRVAKVVTVHDDLLTQ